MNTPNWITVTVKSWKPESASYMGTIMRSRKRHMDCSFQMQTEMQPLTLQCQREAAGSYGFSIADAEKTKTQVMAFCSMLLQCPEVESVLLTYRDVTWHTKTGQIWCMMKRCLFPQRWIHKEKIQING